MTRVPNTTYSALGTDFERATEGADLFKKEDLQKLAYATEVSDHSAGYGLPVARLKATCVLQSADATHNYVFATSPIGADRVVTWPNLTADDTLVFEKQAQTLSGKTLTSPVLNNPTVSGPVTGAAGLRSDTSILAEIDYDNNGTAEFFAVRQNGTTADLFRVNETGQAWLPQAGAGGGLRIGGDVDIYRSAADQATTPDDWIARTLRSTVAVGTAPLVVASTTQVVNLHADLVDGVHVGNGSGQAPWSNGVVNTNLNADLLDGYHADENATATTVAARNASGYLFASFFNSVAELRANDTPNALIGRIGGGDNYHRWYDAASVRNMLLAVDGSGSGLDADLLDGNDYAGRVQNVYASGVSSAPVNLTTSFQVATAVATAPTAGTYLVLWAVDFLSGTTTGDNGFQMIADAYDQTNAASLTPLAVFACLTASGSRARATVCQHAVYPVSGATNMVVRVRKDGGTGDSQCISPHTSIRLVRLY